MTIRLPLDPETPMSVAAETRLAIRRLKGVRYTPEQLPIRPDVADLIANVMGLKRGPLDFPGLPMPAVKLQPEGTVILFFRGEAGAGSVPRSLSLHVHCAQGILSRQLFPEGTVIERIILNDVEGRMPHQLRFLFTWLTDDGEDDR